MKVESVEKEFCKMEFSYWADPEVVEEKITEAVEALRKSKIPGFRPGKAPDSAIKMKCKKQIHNWVASQMVTQAYDDIIFETDIKPIGQAKLEEVKFTDKNYFCRLTIQKKPEFTLTNYIGLEVPRPNVGGDIDALVEGSIFSIRVRFGEYVPFGDDDVVAQGDKVTMTSEAFVGDVPFERGTAEGLLYKIGDNKFPEFDQFLIGMRPDEEREFELVIDEQTVKFKVTVHMGLKVTPHPLDQALCDSCGVKDVDELKENLRKITAARIKDNETTGIKNQVCKQLLATHDFEIPQFLIDAELKSLYAQYYVVESELKEENKAELLKKAVNSIKLTLILDSIKNEEPESFMSDNEAYEVLVNKLRAQGQDPNVFVAESQKNRTIHGILESLKNDFVLEWLVSKVKILE